MKNILKSFIVLLVGVICFQNLNAENISGKVLYQGDSTRPVGNVTVTLKNTDNNSTQTFLTGVDGFYQFTNVSNGNFKLSGTKTNGAGGVSYQDAVLVFLNLIGMYTFTPMQFMASDVNGTGTITWSDYNLIIYHILFNTPFPVGPWTFESSTFAVSNLKDGVPHGIGGTCSGDVGGTFVPTVNNTPALPVTQEGTINVSSGEPFTTRILTHSEFSITGTGIIINYPADLLQIESVDFKGADYEYNVEGGQIRLVWGNPNTPAIQFNEGETFITIHGVAASGFKQGMSATISLDGNTSLMNALNQEITNLKFATPVIKYGNTALRLSNYPNPVTTTTKLSIYAQEEGNAMIEVYNASGQLVKNIAAGQINAGYNEYILDATQLSRGYYICKLRIQTANAELQNSIRIVKAE